MSSQDFISLASKRISKNKETTESDIELAFVKHAKNQGCKALKLILLNKKGFPDRTVLCPNGEIFFIEFKRKGKKQSPAQSLVQSMLLKLGFSYYVCDEIGQAENHLDLYLIQI